MGDFELNFSKFMFKFNSGDRRRLWIKLSKLLSNGVPILDALISMQKRRLDSGMKKDPMTVALTLWIEKIKNGRRLSQAIEGWVEHDEQMLLAAGEQSGNLATSLESTAEIIEAKRKIRAAVLGGVSYPFAMLALAFGVLIMFSFKIIPAFSRIVSDDKWTGTAAIMIKLSNFSRDWIIWILIAAVVLIVMLFLSFPRWKDGLRIKLDRYPPYSIYRMLHGSTWMISFAALVGAGVRIEQALQQLGDGASPWMRVRVNACLRGMRAGMNPGDALAKSGYGFPDVEIIDDLGVYARLSGFDSALSIIGREWMTESVEQIQNLMKVVFGISVLTVGLFVAFMVGGLIGMELQLASIMQGNYR